jgi:hypothetical protein
MGKLLKNVTGYSVYNDSYFNVWADEVAQTVVIRPRGNELQPSHWLTELSFYRLHPVVFPKLLISVVKYMA